ncbi:hypothetical protein [Kiloniella sp.]|uniref:hypothetical protein n=1 Tax=Kiloniella sp. TaxID=1938587 RepID=UPI003A8FFFEC
MATFKLLLKKDSNIKQLQLASVHLKPDDPYRGQEMIKAADWLISQSIPTIVTGDMNWGYKKTSNVINYKGEAYISKLHEEEKLFQVFKEISYLNNGTSTKLRTNMGFRKTRFMYDQSLLSPSLANHMADGGKLLADTGFIAFGMYETRMKKVISKNIKKMSYGLDKYSAHLDQNLDNSSFLDATNKIQNRANDEATYRISDHRPIWLQLKIY